MARACAGNKKIHDFERLEILQEVVGPFDFVNEWIEVD